jgi:NADPH:quinone reductase-like Zn-dependent oxidoreductase
MAIMISTALPTESTPSKSSFSAPTVVISQENKNVIEGDEIASALGRELQLNGLQVMHRNLKNWCSEIEPSSTIFIFTHELQNAFLSHISSEEFSLLQDITRSSKGVIWLTRCGGSETHSLPDLRMIDGLSRTLRKENPATTLITVHFETTESSLSPQQLKMLIEVIRQTDFGCGGFDYESEYTEVAGRLHIARTSENLQMSQELAHHSTQRRPKLERLDLSASLELKIQTPGRFDTFYFTEDTMQLLPLPHDEVEIQVIACGVLFRDCLVTLGKMQDDVLGRECAGVVLRAGSSTNLEPGDRVFGLSSKGTYKTITRMNHHCLQKIPERLTFTEAASFGVALVTAHYGLSVSAQMKAGESILIHSAAGGTGQAALQLAKILGAGEIFATVSSTAKKEFLMQEYGIPGDHIFSSRDTTFATHIQRLTKNGVDIILNSLSGEGLRASWSCIAPYGRFIEIGKRDILANDNLPMLPFLHNVSYAAIDVSDMISARPKLIGDSLSATMSMLQIGRIKIRSPVKVYPVSKVMDAFQYMQIGQNIGRVVVEMVPDALIPVILYCYL